MEIDEDPLYQYNQHHVFRELVFHRPLSNELRVALSESMNPTLPIVDDRHTNAIAIQQELQKLNNAVADPAEIVKPTSWKLIFSKSKNPGQHLLRPRGRAWRRSSTEGQIQDNTLARLPASETLPQSQEPAPQQELTGVQQMHVTFDRYASEDMKIK
ncbi:hypothetical protein EDD21DRAFT_419451 [Dissophora ornata]|nr:hypothetical protein EDD21DRAFT_419451 [Dissophora ornata]